VVDNKWFCPDDLKQAQEKELRFLQADRDKAEAKRNKAENDLVMTIVNLETENLQLAAAMAKSSKIDNAKLQQARERKEKQKMLFFSRNSEHS